MLFSVIIPFYNRGHLVSEVLDSVSAQTERDYEVIAVDDGSTDDTFARLQQHPTRPQCIRIDNQGAAMARNHGAAAAGGRYLAFLDSDDLWFPATLALYRQVLEEHGYPSILTGNPLVFNEGNEPTVPEPVTPEVESFTCYLDSFSEWRWFGVSSFVIRRDSFERVGGFARKRINAEDADLMLRLGTAPGFVHIRKPCTFAYREHAANLTKNLEMGLSGIRHLVENEQNGRYPGTGSLAGKRRFILSRHLRPVILEALKAGDKAAARELLKPSLPWLLRQGRFRFLAYVLLRLVLP
jgi:glycosyltransferase involved in cell wall biosynthesis